MERKIFIERMILQDIFYVTPKYVLYICGEPRSNEILFPPRPSGCNETFSAIRKIYDAHMCV